MRPSAWRPSTAKTTAAAATTTRDEAFRRTLLDAFVFLTVVFAWCVASPLLASDEFEDTVLHASSLLVKRGVSPSLPRPLTHRASRRYFPDDDDDDGGTGSGPGAAGRPRLVLLPDADAAGWRYAVVYFSHRPFDLVTRVRVFLTSSSRRRRSRLVIWSDRRVVADAVIDDDDDDDDEESAGWDLRNLHCGGGGDVGVGVLGLAVWTVERRGSNRSTTTTTTTTTTAHLAVARASKNARIPAVRLDGTWVSADLDEVAARWNALLPAADGSNGGKRGDGVVVALAPSIELLTLDDKAVPHLDLGLLLH